MSRLRPVSAGLLLSAYMLTIAPGGGSTRDSSQEVFLRDYPAAVQRLELRYRQVHGSGRLIETRQNAERVPQASETKISFAFEGDSLKTTSTRGGDGGDTQTRITCTTADGGFRVEVPRQGAPPVLKSTEKGHDNAARESIEQFRDQYVNAPFFMTEVASKLLTSPNVTIRRVEELESDGRKLFKVAFVREVLGRSRGEVQSARVECSMTVSPEEGWVIREYELKAPKATHTVKIEYGEPIEGIAAPKRVDYVSPNRTRTFEFDEFAFGPTDPREFTLEAAGLPGLAKPGVSQARNVTPYWLIGGGCLAGLVAIGFGILARRHKTQLI